MNDHRNMEDFIVEPGMIDQPVLQQVLPVVGGQRDHRVLGEVILVEEPEDFTDMFVRLEHFSPVALLYDMFRQPLRIAPANG